LAGRPPEILRAASAQQRLIEHFNPKRSQFNEQETTMKFIASTLVALSVLAGIAGPAAAYYDGQDAHQRYFEQLQRNSG
jgi:hypothetical protein